MDDPVADAGRPAAMPPVRAGIAGALSWMVVAQVVSQTAWFGSLVVLGILLPPSAFGSIATGMVIVSVAVLLMGAGTYGSIVTTRQPTAAQIRRAVLLNFGIGVALATAGAVFAGPLIRNFARGGQPAVLQGLVASVVVYSLAIVPVALLVKHMQTKRYAVVSIVATGGASVGAVIAAFAGAGVWALVGRQVAYQALLAAGAWWAARDLLPGDGARDEAPAEAARAGARSRGGWFFLLALVEFIAFNADYVIVGKVRGATQLGLYSLAFSLAFAPLRQIVWQVGGVFFSASAAEDDHEKVRSQLLKALQIAALLFLPLLPPALVIAPVLVRAVLGNEWGGMVAPFQLLLLVGSGHAFVNIMGEFLGGTGHVAFRARVSACWAAATVLVMWLLVQALGIVGAALTHVLLFVPLAAVYAVAGARRMGVPRSSLAGALRPVVVAVTLEALCTAGVWAGLGLVPVPEALRAVAAAAAGMGLALLLLNRDPEGPLAQAKRALSQERARRAARTT